jgi:hypothetical protein
MFGFITTRPNRWHWALLPLVLAVLLALAFGAAQMAVPFAPGQATPLSLDPAALPYYLLRTTLRILAALGLSLLFAFVFAALPDAAIGAGAGLPGGCRGAVHRLVPGPPARRRVRGDLCDLHFASMEYGVQPVSVHAQRAGRTA